MKRFVKYLIFATLILGNVWIWTDLLRGCSNESTEQDDEREPLPENVALAFFLSQSPLLFSVGVGVSAGGRDWLDWHADELVAVGLAPPYPLATPTPPVPA